MTIGENHEAHNDSIYVSHEDLEKRRLDRERAKKLSQETNRRRKALEDRKRLAAEREKRKISLELIKRKQKQSEATEKYQRSTFSARSERRRPKTTYVRGMPSLDNILQQLRSGSTEISYGLGTDVPTNRVKTESRFDEQSNALLEHHKLKTKQDFKNELRKIQSKSAPVKKVDDTTKENDEDNYNTGLNDSLNASSNSTVPIAAAVVADKHNTHAPVPAYGYTKADLMSGSTHPDQHQLEDSMSRLFIHNQNYNRQQQSTNYQLPPRTKQIFTSNNGDTEEPQMKIQDADDDEEIVFKSSPHKYDGNKNKNYLQKQPSQFELLEDSLDASAAEATRALLNQSLTDSTFDEDSLHGSTTSPPNNNKQEQVEKTSKVYTTSNIHEKQQQHYVHTKSKVQHSEQDSSSDMTAAVAGGAWTNDKFYFKSYRPRTASNNNRVEIKQSPPATEIRVIEPWQMSNQDHSSSSRAKSRMVPCVSQGINNETTPTVQFGKDNKSSHKTAVGSGENVDKQQQLPKGILKKVSKYASTPDSSEAAIYNNYNAAAIVRQQWVNEIGIVERHQPPLNDVARRKSVKWNEIQYDDGTSASILESGGGRSTSSSQPSSEPSSPNTTTKSSSSKATGRSKASSKGKKSAAGGSGNKKAAAANRSSKKFRPSKESNELSIEPHPPLVSKKKQLSTTNALHYSIHDDDDTAAAASSKSSLRSKVAWKEVATPPEVTLDNLKSCGSDDANNKQIESVTSERTGNHVTIHVVTSEANNKNEAADSGSSSDVVVNLSKTPTDQEINLLWENVRSCIAKRPGSSKPNLRVGTFDNQNRYGLQPSARSTHGAAKWSQQVASPQQPSIVSIDGGMLMQHDNNRSYNQYRVASSTAQQRRRGRRFIRPTSGVVSAPLSGRNNDSYNFYMRHQALLQQRRQKQYMPNGYPNNLKTYPGVKQSHQLPYSSTPRSSTRTAAPEPSQHQHGQTSSTTAFLLAEALAEQNMPEDQIMQALESIQRKSYEAERLGKAFNPSALSIEEQRLLASLERLNSRLDEIESTVSTNPNIGPFNKNMSKPQHNNGKRLRRNQSANEMRLQRTTRY